MKKYVLRRLLQLIPILLAITFLSFGMMRIAGSDVVEQKMENTGSDISQEVQFIFPLGSCKIRYHEKASVSLENIQGDTKNAFINGTGIVQIINLGQGLHHEGQAFFIILYDTHLGNGFYAGLHKQLQLVKAVAFLVVALYIQVADGFNWRCHAFMSGQQYDVDFFVEYRILEPVKYLYNSEEPEDILKNISQSCIRTVIASYDVDEVLTTGKGEIQSKIKEMILKQMEEQDLGIQLVNITIQDSEPPTQEVMKAFKAVETAKQGKETALNNANKYRNEKLPEAEAEADQIIQDAEAQKQVRINEAEAEVARFNAMYEEYVKNPEITKKRMFYEAMEDVLPGMKIVIDNGDGVQKVLPLDSFTGDSSENPTETLNTDPQSAQDTQNINDSENE